MFAVELQNVTKRFGTLAAVDDLSLTVPAGSVYGFIGPNGSGKTTTLRMIMRIIYPNHGSIRVLGEDVIGKGAATDRVAYLPEERGLYRTMKVREIIRFYAELKGYRNPRADIARWLERMGLSDWSDKKVTALSKGMAQKVQFICTVIARPELVILDEPFTGLDPVNAALFIDTILDLKRGGATVILSTHDMSVAEKMCDSIFMIFKGKKVLDGPLDGIQDAYGTDTIRVRVETNGHRLDGIPGVTGVVDFGRYQELRVRDGTDPQAILEHLMKLGTVRHFEQARPSLHDIFIRIAGPEAQEVQHA
ncbi:MAG: ATP-binding cassette domain-containing protein [Phycisphaerales bacterium]|nr:ATP-binding cassette domain-containing protein [Phycisphaerales bacterium]